jgi:cytochrome b
VLAAQEDTRLPAQPDAPAMVQVWDLPLRILHWLLALSVLIAWSSANIFDTVHEIAGYMTLAAVALRLAWGIFGTHHARFQNFIRPPAAVWRYLVQAAHRQPGRYLGLNPAGAAMAITLLLLLSVSTISGWMQLTPRFFGVEWVEQVHTWSSNLALVLVVVHVLGVLAMAALQKENLIAAMITGQKRRRES